MLGYAHCAFGDVFARCDSALSKKYNSKSLLMRDSDDSLVPALYIIIRTWGFNYSH